tara:strand:- start:116 stop:394 length:279 start_codon:yes stop_codon:yes gene_type:complete
MLLEALEWLAREAIVDKSLSRAARSADKLLPGLGVVVYRVAGGAQAGAIVGSYAGQQTAENVTAGIPSTVALDYTPEIALYERSAVGSSRII